MTNKDIAEFFEALKLLAKEKGIDVEYLLERIKAAIVVAVKKDFGGKENILVVMNPETNEFSVILRKTVVEEVILMREEMSPSSTSRAVSRSRTRIRAPGV